MPSPRPNTELYLTKQSALGDAERGACLFAVLVIERLAEVSNLVLEYLQLLVGELIDLDALIAEFLNELIVLLLNDVATPVASLDCLLLENLLGCLIQSVESVAVEDDKVVFVGVVPDGNVLLNFENSGGAGDADAVFLTVNCGPAGER